MTTHSEARAYARQALQVVFPGVVPESGEVAALAGIGCLETSYGDGWKGVGRGSNNMGAIQAGVFWHGPTFSYQDTNPTSSGANVAYTAAFRKYATPIDGWIDLARVAYSSKRTRVREAARRNDLLGVSRELFRSGYYTGFGTTPEIRIANHHRALARAVHAADAAILVPPRPAVEIPPTVRRGSRGEAVTHLQHELGIVADGIFGAVTEVSLRMWQASHGLETDGICGPKTWAELLK